MKRIFFVFSNALFFTFAIFHFFFVLLIFKSREYCGDVILRMRLEWGILPCNLDDLMVRMGFFGWNFKPQWDLLNLEILAVWKGIFLTVWTRIPLLQWKCHCTHNPFTKQQITGPLWLQENFQHFIQLMFQKKTTLLFIFLRHLFSHLSKISVDIYFNCNHLFN